MTLPTRSPSTLCPCASLGPQGGLEERQSQRGVSQPRTKSPPRSRAVHTSEAGTGVSSPPTSRPTNSTLLAPPSSAQSLVQPDPGQPLRDDRVTVSRAPAWLLNRISQMHSLYSLASHPSLLTSLPKWPGVHTTGQWL